jgi:hypothetical protein
VLRTRLASEAVIKAQAFRFGCAPAGVEPAASNVIAAAPATLRTASTPEVFPPSDEKNALLVAFRRLG